MGKRTVIAVSKSHGFHEPTPQGEWKIPEEHPMIHEARLAGVDVELFLYGTSRKPGKRMSGNWIQTLRGELEAVQAARQGHWIDYEEITGSQDRASKYRVRAIQAEKREKEFIQENEMLRTRLKQGDNGQGDWLNERDALLTQLEEAEENLRKAREDLREMVGHTQELEEMYTRKIQNLESNLPDTLTASAPINDSTVQIDVAAYEHKLLFAAAQTESLRSEVKRLQIASASQEPVFQGVLQARAEELAYLRDLVHRMLEKL